MAKPTIPYQKITANPSHLVDCPPASDRTRLAAPHKIEEGQSDMQMMHRSQFQPAFEIDAEDVLVLPAGLSGLASTTTWSEVLEVWQKADAARRAYGEEIFDPAWDAAHQQRQAEERALQRLIDEIPHYTTERTYVAEAGRRHMSTSSQVDVRAALTFHQDDDDGEFTLCCRELVRGIGKRFAAEQEIRDNFEFSHAGPFDPAIEREMRRLEQLEQQAWDAVAKFPVATPGDFVAKIKFLRSQGCGENHADVQADLARIWGGERRAIEVADWQAAMSAYISARDAYHRQRTDDLCDAMIDAENRLRSVRAPDLEALEWKIWSLRAEAEDAGSGMADLDVMLDDIRDIRTIELVMAVRTDLEDIAANSSPFIAIYQRFMAAFNGLNAAMKDAEADDGSALSEVYHTAAHDLAEARPATDREFRLKFMALWREGGAPSEATIARMLEDAQALGGS